MTDRPDLRDFGDLTPADFEAHPVWVNCHVIDYEEPWYDETDEETFRPWTGELPVSPHHTMFLVRAELVLNDGAHCKGFVTPAIADDPGIQLHELATMQPHLFLPNQELAGFWLGVFSPGDDDCRRVYDALGKEAADVFPIRFAAKEGLATGRTSGTIEGFYWLEDHRHGFLWLRRARRAAWRR